MNIVVPSPVVYHAISADYRGAAYVATQMNRPPYRGVSRAKSSAATSALEVMVEEGPRRTAIIVGRHVAYVTSLIVPEILP